MVLAPAEQRAAWMNDLLEDHRYGTVGTVQLLWLSALLALFLPDSHHESLAVLPVAHRSRCLLLCSAGPADQARLDHGEESEHSKHSSLLAAYLLPCARGFACSAVFAEECWAACVFAFRI